MISHPLTDPTASSATIFAYAKDFRFVPWRGLKSKKKYHENKFSFYILFPIFIFFFTSSLFADEKIFLHLKWFHQFQFAGYYAALEKGYYTEAGLDVEIIESQNGSSELNQKVIAKEGNYGIGDTDLLLARKEGLPVVVLAVIFQHSPNILITKRTNPTQSIHEIVGKRVMLAPNSAEIKAYLKKEGIEESDYTPVDYSFQFDDLMSGRVYAMNGYSTAQSYLFKKSHFDFQAYSPRSVGIDFYGDNLFTSEKEISEHPERAKAFRKASLLGWQYALEHKEEMIDLIISKYQCKYERAQLDYEAEQMIPLIQPVLVEIGYMNSGRWKHITEVYGDLGMIPKNINLEKFLYDPLPKQNLTWVYRTITAVLGIFAVIGLFQWRKLSKEYKSNLIKEVELRTEELHKSNQGLTITNKYLEKTLDQLTDAQNRLLLSEKLATLGQLAAGMAHELNTPLGAILSSNQAVTYFFEKEFKSISIFLSRLQAEDRERFQLALEESLKESTYFDGREERNLKKELSERFSDIPKMAKDNDHVQLIIESGVYRLGDRLRFILESENSLDLLTAISQIATAFRLNRVITIAADKAAHAIRALQSYLEPDENKQETFSSVAIVNEIETILSLYHNQLKNRVKVKKTFLTNRPCIGNRDKLNQIWINLLNNALQAMSYSGELEIKIEMVNGWIKTSFIDSGIGIPEEHRDKIFEPFFTTKRQGGGMGLGLDITKKIITSMNGKIEFESEPGKTCFSVWLRCEETSTQIST